MQDISAHGTNEQTHVQKVIYNIHRYEYYALEKIKQRALQYAALSAAHKELVPDFLRRIPDIRSFIKCNQHFLDCICPEYQEQGSFCISDMDIDHVRSTLRQFVRDWSLEGREERGKCYGPILNALCRLYPIYHGRHGISVLVPGSGLSRLAYEIAKQGFHCQGNEFSLYMLLGSQLILNNSESKNHFTIYPYILQCSNVVSSADPLHAVQIPDECPSDHKHLLSDFSMTGGDFLDVYTEEKSWDCVVTCFFIDTAHNILACMERIYKILKPGGHWVNVGPLLYHFEDSVHDSLELSAEDVLSASRKLGFEFIKSEESDFLPGCDHVQRISTSYAQNVASMMQYIYHTMFFIARKPE